MDIKKIDSALLLTKEFGTITNGVTSPIHSLRQKYIFSDGEVSKKHKSFAALLIAIRAQCEPCIRFYVAKAVEYGGSEKELGEYLAVASAMGGCIGEMWAMKAFKAYKDMTSSLPQDDRTKENEAHNNDPSCCE